MLLHAKELCSKLQNGERRCKVEALTDLRHMCNDKKEDPTVILRYFDDLYLHLLKCYSDRFEIVRDNAVETVTAFIQRLPPCDFHLMNIVSTLVERMGQQETLETSEEIRLLYANQMSTLIDVYVKTDNVNSLKECYDSIVKVLVKSVKDSYSMVQRQAGGSIAALAVSAETQYFQPFCEPLAIAIYPMLNHKHSQTRIAAIRAISQLSLHIKASEDALKRLIMEVSPLLMDSIPMVRLACGEMGILMLLKLRDRYSYFERIIPLVLCCLKDDSPEVVDAIRVQWLDCGKLYYEENEMELNRQDLSDPKPENYPEKVERPTIGCRGLVQRSLRLLMLITRESSDWKDNVRLHSLKLLYQFVLHAEAAMTAKFFEIYPDVARACRDEEVAVQKEAKKVADLMGRLFSYVDWIDHGLDGLENNRREGYLKCFYYMLKPSLNVPLKDLLRVTELMKSGEFSKSLKPEIQTYVLKLLNTVLDKADDLIDINARSREELEEAVYISCIKVAALVHSAIRDPTDNLVRFKLLIDRIGLRQQCTTSDLHKRYFSLALEDVENLDAPLEETSEPILLLHGLIGIAGLRAAYLEQLKDKIKVVWRHCSDEAKLKIFTTISIISIDWSLTIDVDIKESADLMDNFIKEIVEPHLKWSAGSNSESMRSMAMVTLCCLSQSAIEEAQTILPKYAKYFPNLLQDHCATTRSYALRALIFFPALPVQDLNPLAYAILQRLDDPSSNIRMLAAKAIPTLKPIFPGENNQNQNQAEMKDNDQKEKGETVTEKVETVTEKVETVTEKVETVTEKLETVIEKLETVIEREESLDSKTESIAIEITEEPIVPGDNTDMPQNNDEIRDEDNEEKVETETETKTERSVSKVEPDTKENTEEDYMGDPTRESWLTYIKRVLDMLILLYEGPESVNKTILEHTLQSLANQYPKQTNERMKVAIDRAYNKKDLEELFQKFDLNSTD